MPEATLTLLDLLEQAVKKNPAAPAVLGQDRTVVYGQLLGEAQALGAEIAGLTTKPVVALFLPMFSGFPSAFFGALYAGKAILPLNMLLGPEDLGFILQDAGVDLVITLADFKPKLEKLPLKVVALQDLKPVPGKPLPPRPKPTDTSVYLYTSGTTGKPKGVELTHHNLASNANSSIQAMGFTSDYRVLACLPTFHTYSITATMLAPLFAGGSLYTIPKFDPHGCLRAASSVPCNTLMMVPSMYRLFTRLQEREKMPMEHLKLAIAGGEPLPDETRTKFEEVFKIPLLEGYGQTEASPVISFNVRAANKPGTVGKPVPGVSVKIMNLESGSPVPAKAGETGELWVSGPSIMKGYHNRPEETAKALTSDGWLRTGDMGIVDAEGFLKITGRLREMIKVAGEMVFPAEVENALLMHPAVAEAGVLGVKSERHGEEVRAFVALHPGKTVTADELLEHCKGLLAAYKMPKGVEFRPELPKGPTGKVIRRLLK